MAGYGNWIASTGVPPVVTQDHTQCTLTEPGSIEALNYLKGLLDQGIMPTISQLGGTGAADEYNLFKSEKVAMMSTGNWNLPNVFNDVTFNWDVVQLPKNPTTGESRALLHATSWVGSSNRPSDPNPALQQAWIDSFGDSPINVQAFVDATQNSQGITVFSETDSATADMLVNIFDLGMSVEDATAQACAEIEPYLAPAS
jgi:ABC-type glycerol-3-phosphate transport system substrate-binding protein